MGLIGSKRPTVVRPGGRQSEELRELRAFFDAAHSWFAERGGRDVKHDLELGTRGSSSYAAILQHESAESKFAATQAAVAARAADQHTVALAALADSGAT